MSCCILGVTTLRSDVFPCVEAAVGLLRSNPCIRSRRYEVANSSGSTAPARPSARRCCPPCVKGCLQKAPREHHLRLHLAKCYDRGGWDCWPTEARHKLCKHVRNLQQQFAYCSGHFFKERADENIEYCLRPCRSTRYCSGGLDLRAGDILFLGLLNSSCKMHSG